MGWAGKRAARSQRLRGLVALLAIVVAAGAVLASGSTNKAEKVNGNGSSSSVPGSTPPSSGGASAPFKVGDEVKLGDWTVKVWGVADPQAAVNQYAKPTAGSRWVGLDAEVRNLSSDPANVSSILCFKVQDSANREYTEDIATGIKPEPPDGEVAPGAAKRGTIVFEVPAEATGLKLNFKCELFSSGTATIQLTP